MNNQRCEICGGINIINIESGLVICNSCGNTVETDAETLNKYRNLLNAADRKMMYNSVKYYTEAIKILEDIPFVDGVSEKIEYCNKKITEIDNKQSKKEITDNQSDSNNSKIGIIIAAVVIAAFILMASVIGIMLFKLIKGELSTGGTYLLLAVAALFVVAFFIGKTKLST